MLLILCPKSRAGKGKQLWRLWLDFLNLRNVNFKSIETEYAGHATELAKCENNSVVAVGGDGTINEVINGVKLASPQPKFGILYSGTSPDFCRFHQLDLKPEFMVKPLVKCCSKKIDLVEINYDNKSEYFACSANLGLGSDIADFSNKYRPYIGDLFGTLLGAVRAFFVNKPFSAEISVDGEFYMFDSCNHIMLIKNPYIASGIKFGLDISPNDGKAFILIIKDKSKLGLLKLLPKLYSGKKEHLESVDFWVKPFKDISIKSDQCVNIEFDGDSKGCLPLTASVSKDSIDLIY